MATTGCRQLLGFEELAGADAPSADAAGDASSNAFCYGTAPIRPCLPEPPEGILSLGGTLNTDVAGACQSIQLLDGISVCVLAAEELVVASPLRVTGSHPLVLLATGTLTVLAPIDASSSSQGRGAGSPGPCTSTPSPTSNGGPGGSFSGLGGAGGASSMAPAIPAAPAVPPTLRGGCDGGGNELTSDRVAGAGGGALALIAQTLELSSAITVSGAGGTGGAMGGVVGGGGGGGGSGGYLAIDAAIVTATPGARLLAVGGGGGGGGCVFTPGEAGDDALLSVLVGGGMGATPAGGNGGQGSTSSLFSAAGADASGMGCGGGGGGGGAGAIQLFQGDPCALPGQCTPDPIRM